jgi:hypothetical protein
MLKLAISIFYAYGNINTPLAFAADSAEKQSLELRLKKSNVYFARSISKDSEKKNIKTSDFDLINSSDGSSADTVKFTELAYQRSFLNNKITTSF